MSVVARAGRRRLVGLFVAVLALAFAVALPVFSAKGASPTAAYVVQLSSPPVASYHGGTRGIPATSPLQTRRKVQNSSSAARAYRSFLDGRQRAALARLGGDKPAITYSYRTAFAGFAARLTETQVRKLRKAPEVARVSKDELWKKTDAASDNAALDNTTHPDGAAYLDLPEGLWNRLGGSAGAGEGVIVGDIDTGIQPGHPSFADTAAGNYTGPDYTAVPSTWGGTCQTGDGNGWSTADCNNKLIGARFFVAGFGTSNLDPESFISPRDDDGHGSHTASTAAGNFGVDPSIDGNDLGVTQISGIAPRARIAMYKVCWVGNNTTSASGCTNSDSIAAIDAAVSDGVDVINYSIGSSDSQILGSVEIAFLGASDAGVFVANSAGNDGPGAGTVGSPTSVPWLTSVAASSLARTFQSTAAITNASPTANFSVNGASVTAALPATTLVDALGSGLTGVDPADAELCLPDTLDPLKVAGKVVLCKRGDNSRIDKSHNVFDEGGLGMILFNAADAQELVTDTHFVPSVHVSNSDGLAVRAAITASGGTAEAALTAGTAVPFEGAVLAAFSSRGPQTAVPDIARPDVTAPGVNILAAAADLPAPNSELKQGNLFQSISGTSMASPHVAGAAALLTQLHPTFSASALKSALMTTANPDVLREDATTPADVFDAGSGEIDPTLAADPGLVVEASTDDYVNYVAAVLPDAVDGDVSPIQPFDLNLPSISNSKLAGTASTSRTFTSVDSVAEHWTVAVEDLDGITATPSVSAFTIKPGQSREIGLDFQVGAAPLGDYAFGALVLTNGIRTVRVPISLKPVPLAAPSTIKVQTALASGTQAIPPRVGFAGQLRSLGWGLAAPSVKVGETITSSPTGGPFPNPANDGTKVYPVNVPAATQLLSTRLSNVDGGDANTDLDLFLYVDSDHDGAITEDDDQVGSSASGSSLEHIELLPGEGEDAVPAGLYGVVVVGFTTKAPSSVYDLSTWVETDATPDDPGTGPGIKASGDPFTVTPGDEPALALDWSNVTKKGTYMGVVTYHSSATPTFANRIGTSLVELEETADTGGTTTTPPPTTTPPAPTPPGTTPKLRLRLTSARLSGRTLTLRLTSSRRARIQITVRRGGHLITSASSRTVTTKTRVLRVQIKRRVRSGRTYIVRIRAFSGSNVAASSSVRMRVR